MKKYMAKRYYFGPTENVMLKEMLKRARSAPKFVLYHQIRKLISV